MEFQYVERPTHHTIKYIIIGEIYADDLEDVVDVHASVIDRPEMRLNNSLGKL